MIMYYGAAAPDASTAFTDNVTMATTPKRKQEVTGNQCVYAVCSVVATNPGQFKTKSDAMWEKTEEREWECEKDERERERDSETNAKIRKQIAPSAEFHCHFDSRLTHPLCSSDCYALRVRINTRWLFHARKEWEFLWQNELPLEFKSFSFLFCRLDASATDGFASKILFCREQTNRRNRFINEQRAMPLLLLCVSSDSVAWIIILYFSFRGRNVITGIYRLVVSNV